MHRRRARQRSGRAPRARELGARRGAARAAAALLSRGPQLRGRGRTAPPGGFLAQAALHSGEDDDGEERVRRVTLSTLHAAKGCDWDRVLIAGCCEGLLPHEHALRRGEIDEERRLAFVGFTRARRELALSWPRTHGGRP